MGEDYRNQILYSNNNRFNFGVGGETGGYSDGQTTGNVSIFNTDAVNQGLQGQDSGGLFQNWDSQSTANVFKGIGTAANLYFGAQNLKMAKKDMGMKQGQYNAFMQDRAEAKTKRDAVSQIRF